MIFAHAFYPIFFISSFFLRCRIGRVGTGRLRCCVSDGNFQSQGALCIVCTWAFSPEFVEFVGVWASVSLNYDYVSVAYHIHLSNVLSAIVLAHWMGSFKLDG